MYKKNDVIGKTINLKICEKNSLYIKNIQGLKMSRLNDVKVKYLINKISKKTS